MEFDVVVAGAGYVGCSTALALEALGLSVCVLDTKPLAVTVSDHWDVRVFTLSPGTQRFLQGLGIWQELDLTRVASVYRMEVCGDAPGGHITFDAMAAGVERLASVVEGSRLQAALVAAVKRRRIEVRAPVFINRLDWQRDAVSVHLDGGAPLRCRLLIGADGTDSQIRVQAGIEMHYRGYAQMGVVANFLSEKPSRGRAFQWFRKDGVLAFLPLPDRAISMVWSTGVEHAAQLQAHSGTALCEEVGEASRHALGALQLISPVRAFPLRYARASRCIGVRMALVGDAAHTVHPLAGQGVNLGFRDVESLVDALKEFLAGADVGAAAALKRYQSARAEDTMSVFALTDGLHKLFATSNPVLRALRNEGMHWVDGMQMAKNALMRRAML